MYRIWMEWDYGQDNMVFVTKALAMQWLQELVDDPKGLGGEFSSLDELFDSGWVGIDKLQVIGAWSTGHELQLSD